MVLKGELLRRHGLEELKVYENIIRDILCALDFCQCPEMNENFKNDEK